MKHLIAKARAAHRKARHIGAINHAAAHRRGRSYVAKQKLKNFRFNKTMRNTKRRPF